jgi:molybdate transport system substrate-binding protein
MPPVSGKEIQSKGQPFQVGLFFAFIMGTRIFFSFLAICLVMASSIADAMESKASVSVAAASDLTHALKEIAASCAEDTGIEAVISFGSTGTLASQIENGAPFDVFLSADMGRIERLKDKGLVLLDTIEPYALGTIVIAVNKASDIKAAGLRDLLNPRIRRIAIANPLHAPYGKAAMEALKSSGVWDGIRERLVYGEDVRQTLKFIQSGDAEAGVVSLSIADAPEIASTPIPVGLHSPIVQAAAVVKGSRDERAARDFLGYLKTEKAKAALKRYGFRLP